MGKLESKTEKKASRADVEVGAILVPVDFSEGSDAAVDEAVDLAKTFGASIEGGGVWPLRRTASRCAAISGSRVHAIFPTSIAHAVIWWTCGRRSTM